MRVARKMEASIRSFKQVENGLLSHHNSSMIKRIHFHLPHIKKWVLGTLVGVLLAVVLADAYFEIVGLPGPLRQWALEAMRERGVVADADRIKIGLVRGVKLYDVIIWDQRRGADTMLEAERIHCRISLPGMLTGRPALRSFKLSGGTVDLPLSATTEPLRPLGPLSIRSLRAEVEWNPRRNAVILKPTEALIEGVRIKLAGSLIHFPAPAPGGGVLGWQRFSLLQSPAVQQQLVRVDDFLKTNRFTPNAAWVDVYANIDLNHPDTSSIQGDFRFHDVTVKGIRMPEIVSSFRITPDTLSLRKLRLSLAQDTVIDGEITLALPRQHLSLKIDGSLDPKLAFRLFDIPLPRPLAETTFITPPHVRLTLTGPLRDPGQWQADCRFRINGLKYGSAYLQTASGRIVHDARGRTQFQNLQAVFNQRGSGEKHPLKIDGWVDHEKNAFSIAVQGPAQAESIIQAMGRDHMNLRLKRLLDQFNFERTDIHLDMELTGVFDTPKTWAGKVKIDTNPFRFRALPVERLSVDLDIDEGILATPTPLHVVIAETPKEFIEIDARFDCDQRSINASIQGALNPLNCYRAAGLADITYLDETHFQGPPAKFNFTLEQSPVDTPLQWRGNGTLALDNVRYESMQIDAASANVGLSNGHLSFSQVEIKSPTFQLLSIDHWDINLNRTEITVSGTAVGDPKDLGIFTDRGQSRREYQAIWDGFDWGQEPPTIHVQDLKYVQYPDEITRWRLMVEAEITDTDASYRGFHADEISGIVRFDLPNKASVTDINIKRADGHVQGNIYFDFTTDPVWWFDCSGQLDPSHLFQAADEEAAEAFAILDFNDETRFNMNGKIHMRGGLNPEIDARFSGPEMSFRSFKLENFALAWKLVDNDLRWEIARAQLHEGTLVANGLYNWFSRTGTFDAVIKDSDLSMVMADMGNAEIPPELGRLNAEVHTEYRQWSEDRPINIRGDGMLVIREGRLWEAPIVKQLGGVVGLGNLGRISELQADLVFDGNTLVVPRFNTDGTILSLEGDGAYDWSDQSLNFNVKGRALKTTGVIGRVFTPLTWLFEARLQGTIGEPNWVPMSRLRNLLPGGGGE